MSTWSSNKRFNSHASIARRPRWRSTSSASRLVELKSEAELDRFLPFLLPVAKLQSTVHVPLLPEGPRRSCRRTSSRLPLGRTELASGEEGDRRSTRALLPPHITHLLAWEERIPSSTSSVLPTVLGLPPARQDRVSRPGGPMDLPGKTDLVARQGPSSRWTSLVLPKDCHRPPE